MSLNPHQEFRAFHIRLNDLGSYINCSLCANRNKKLCSIVLQSNTSDFHQTCSDCDAAPQKKKGHWINLLSSNPNLIYWSNIIKIEWASYQLKKNLKYFSTFTWNPYLYKHKNTVDLCYDFLNTIKGIFLSMTEEFYISKIFYTSKRSGRWTFKFQVTATLVQ